MIDGVAAQRADALRRTLDQLVDGGPQRPTAQLDDGDDAWSLGLAAFVASWRLDHTQTRSLADLALERLPEPWGSDPEATVLTCAALALAGAGIGMPGGWNLVAQGRTPTGDPVVDGMALLPRLAADSTAEFTRYALAEAALACARVDLAGVIASTMLVDSGAALEHPYSIVVRVLVARVAAFRGHITEAAAILEQTQPSGVQRLDRLADATRGLVSGNASQAALVRRLADELADPIAAPDQDRIDLGASLLIAFGLIAVGEVRRSAGVALAVITAGPAPMIVDRMLALELALAAAILDNDLDAAQSWLAAAADVTDDPIADSTVARMRSRVAMMAGDADAAAAFAMVAVDLAATNGRAIELAEAEILVAQAEIAAGRTGQAGRRLSAVVAERAVDGYRAVHRSASATLRTAGRRLPPARGSGDLGLTGREREVRDLLLAGQSNAEIAARLHLSPHTVRVHVSRVLAAHGVPTRFALVAATAARLAGGGALELDAAHLAMLTQRQHAVVRHLVTGASNAEIASRLAIAVRTVEKHLGGVMQRWGARGRAEVVAIAVGAMEPPAGR